MDDSPRSYYISERFMVDNIKERHFPTPDKWLTNRRLALK